uniref:Uncharacterized protein LOC117355830 n=1 Tax=Geotrypetes seraphini TaxID=260995 RepID=A0A6P8QT83_GEOSA|nr:uncharacterized protein LOC117355830 [Geotrypetes seraphini]
MPGILPPEVRANRGAITSGTARGLRQTPGDAGWWSPWGGLLMDLDHGPWLILSMWEWDLMPLGVLVRGLQLGEIWRIAGEVGLGVRMLATQVSCLLMMHSWLVLVQFCFHRVLVSRDTPDRCLWVHLSTERQELSQSGGLGSTAGVVRSGLAAAVLESESRQDAVVAADGAIPGAVGVAPSTSRLQDMVFTVSPLGPKMRSPSECRCRNICGT